MTYCGIDLGTSSIKAVLMDEDQEIKASASQALSVIRPRSHWSEQLAEDWWEGTLATLDRLAELQPKLMTRLRGIGISGQMHGATLLDVDGNALRPCILWNDGRAEQECVDLEELEPGFREITGNAVMPGFTAPKLAWVRKHEPAIFEKIYKVLLPKDYIRFKLTGEYVSEMSDSSGTLWLDVAKRDWNKDLLAATGLDTHHMPDLVEGTESSGQLQPNLANRWKISGSVTVAGGGGDNAASACGVGAVLPNNGFISLGTSGVIFVTTERFAPNTENSVHTFCHAIPKSWHQMGVMLSATSCLEWLGGLFKEKASDLSDAVERIHNPSPVLFLPYLSGERTPHNDVGVRGAFYGMDHSTDKKTLTHAVMDGVAFAFRDCMDALKMAGTRPARLTAVGGGSRSKVWLQIISCLLNIPIDILVEGDFGSAFGAARLGICASEGEAVTSICTRPSIIETIDPDSNLNQNYEDAHKKWQSFYPSVKGIKL